MAEVVTTQLLDPGLVDACGPQPGLTCEWIWEATGNETLPGLVDWLIERPLKVAVILIGAVVVNRLVERAIDRLVSRLVESRTREEGEAEAESSTRLAQLGRRARKLTGIHERAERSRQRARTLGGLFRTTTTVAIYVLALLLALGEIGFDLGPLIAGAGIVGFAIGFGAQSMVSDIIAGIFILVEDQYAEGDWVDLGDASGTVEAVNLRTTVLRDIAGSLWTVPNGEIRRVCNFSQDFGKTVLDVDVAYDTDIDLAASVIKEVADELWRENLDSTTIIEEPQIAGVQNFGADSITIRLVVKTEAGEQWATGRLIRARLKKAFDANGIEIPFPQRTVWVHQVDDKGLSPVEPTTQIRTDLLDGGVGGGDAEE